MKLSSSKVIPLKTPYRIAVLKSRAEKVELKELLTGSEQNLLFRPKDPEHMKSFSPLSSISNSKPELLTLPSIRKPSSSLSPYPKPPSSQTSKSPFAPLDVSKSAFKSDKNIFTSRDRYLLSPSVPLDSSKLSTSTTSRSTSNLFSSKHDPQKKDQQSPAVVASIIPGILTLLEKPDSSLTYLNLENSGICDKDIQTLSETLSNDRNLQYLGLARNNLTWVSGRHLKSMLIENYYLVKLDLHWNNLKDLGTAEVFEGLCSNGSLKELDLSWNSVGKCRNLKIIEKISESIRNFEGLAHLDLSFNYLNANECGIIGKALQDNCEIVGLHVIGNEAVTNPQGFLLPDRDSIQLRDSHLFTRIFQEGRKFRKPPNSFCWLCEKWTESEFEFEIDGFGRNLLSLKAIFIHFEVDDYIGEFLPKVDGKFRISRVLPLGTQKFFFSVDGEAFTYALLPSENLNSPLVRQVDYSEIYKEQVSISSLNLVKVAGRPCDYKSPFRTLPRRPKFGYQRVSVRQPKQFWSKDRSLFRDYHFYNEEFFESCYEFDFEQSKLASLIKSANDQQSLKLILMKLYPSVIYSFKTLSIQSGNEIPSVGNNVFIEFLNAGQAFDSLFSSSDLGVNWNAVIVPKKRQTYNPGASLVRYEFIEILVRISHDRYVRNKVCKTTVEAFQYFIKENIQKLLDGNQTETWRNDYLYQEDVDNTLRLFKPVFEAAFKIYSGRKALPGQKPFMSLEEFKQLCFDIGIFDQTVPSRDIDSSFYLSMFWQVDELFEKRHLEMSYYEFLEGFCRAVYYSNAFNKDKSFKSRVFMAAKLVLKVCSKSVQDSFVIPNKSVINGMRVNPKKLPMNR